MLLRSTLSNERFLSEAENVIVTNIIDNELHEENNDDSFFAEDKLNNPHQDSFESCL